jgi:hypothetical protein
MSRSMVKATPFSVLAASGPRNLVRITSLPRKVPDRNVEPMMVHTASSARVSSRGLELCREASV